ncbi:MAG: YCF48-related protein [candidate division KSB1 bacterium]|nr:YCF48-related protein [candidate division KSB1 bacterium]MDZ7369254.1 YCF48-related protein [candidate division KSB1 bacterium]
MKLAKFFLAGAFGFWLHANSASAQTINWQQTNGPLGGTVNEVAVNKTNGYIFAAVEGAGMVRSTDNGESWTFINSGLTNLNVQALAIKTNGDLFVGTNQGVFRSTNNGESWVHIYSGTTRTRNIQALAINAQSGEIFAGASFVNDGTVLRSTDNGATWAEFTNGLAKVGAMQAFAINSATGEIFTGTSTAGVLRSRDRGENWIPVNNGLTNLNVLALIATSTGTLFAGADSSVLKRGIFRSTNNGENWTPVLVTSRSVLSFALNSRGHIFASTSGSGVYLSTDNGNNWSFKNNGFRSLAILALALNANDHIFAGTHCTGVFRSTDNAASWTAINTNLRYTSIVSLAAQQTTGYVFAGSHCGGIFRSTDSGQNWTWAGLPNASVTALATNVSGDIFAGTSAGDPIFGARGRIFRSTDNGTTWVNVSPDDDYFLSFAFSPSGELYAGTGFYSLCGFLNICDYGDIYYSNNNGQNWTKIASMLDDHVHALAVNASGRVFAGTPEGIYRRSGEFWQYVQGPNVRSLLVHSPTGHVFAGASNGILRSIDDGGNWNTIHSLPGNFTWALAMDANGHIYAATEKSGVLRSTDNGVTWQSISTGLTINDIRSLALHHASGQIFAGTNGRGVFRHEQPTAVSEIASEMPASFELTQNYPNPFNPSTTIKYDLPQQVEVKLVIFDMLGRRVRTLVAHRQQTGRYAITWDGRNDAGEQVPSGVYLYRIEAGDFRAARRLTMVK